MEKPSNLVTRIASEPNLIKLFLNLKKPEYQIPHEYEAEIKKLNGLRAMDKGVLVSKVTSVEDYQTQLKLLSLIQHLQDRIHEINTNLYIIQHRYKEMYNHAHKIVMLAYFDELNALKDGVRKGVLQVSFHPICSGLDTLTHLISLGETTQKHLMASNWNVKESSDIIKDYLSLFKFGSSVRLPQDEEV